VQGGSGFSNQTDDLVCDRRWQLRSGGLDGEGLNVSMQRQETFKMRNLNGQPLQLALDFGFTTLKCLSVYHQPRQPIVRSDEQFVGRLIQSP